MSVPSPTVATARTDMLPYGRQTIEKDDIAAVIDVLESDWLTTGPKVAEFESALAQFCGTDYAVVVSNGTAALHAAMHAIGVGPGDEVIVPAITFAATANAVVYCGGIPVFADVEPDTLLIDPKSVEQRITARTRAITAVDYAGQPCDYDALRSICDRKGLNLVADACHALGATDRGRPVGSLADLSTFSFHPVKPITTGEGGAITCHNPELATRMRIFRNHGITTDFRTREKLGSWSYEMTELGFNFRLTDLQCALGISQLAKLPDWIQRRQEIAARYDAAFAGIDGLTIPGRRADCSHGWHIYTIQLAASFDREEVFRTLRAEKIGVNVHYSPVYLHPFYRAKFGQRVGLCPVAEGAARRILTIPIFPRMTEVDIDDVIVAVRNALAPHK